MNRSTLRRPTRTIRALRIAFAGDRITALFRSTDHEAVERGEKVLIEVYQEAHDFAATFELPRDSRALKALLTAQSFCQLHRCHERIACDPLPRPGRTYFAHDGMFGALDSPDEWESARLPEDWPREAGKQHGGNDGVENSLDGRDGAAASGACVVDAALTFDDGSQESWRPVTPAPIQALLEQWPALQVVVSAQQPPG